MSSDNLLQGYVAILATPLTDEERNDKSEMLWENSGKLHYNYDGTLVYINFVQWEDRGDYYGLQIGEDFSYSATDFLSELERFDIKIDLKSILPYREIYYNSGDSNIDLLELEEYEEMLLNNRALIQ